MTQDSYAGQQLTPEQEAILRARAAQQAAAESAARGPAAEQQAVQSQMFAAPVAGGETVQTAGGQSLQRGPLMPAEEQIEALMAAFKAQSEQMQAQIAAMGKQIDVMQRQQEEAQAASGGPLPVRYAQAVLDGLVILAVQHPDLGTARVSPDGTFRVEGHFQPVTAAAAELVSAATDVTRGGPLEPVKALAARIERFMTRDHRLATPKHVEYATVQHHLDAAVAESDKIAA